MLKTYHSLVCAEPHRKGFVMRTLTLTLLFICLLLPLTNTKLYSLQVNSNWQWANKFESPYQYGFSNISMDVDNNGNTYFAGLFRDQLIYGDQSLQCQGSGNLFMGKLNNNGGWQWVRSFWGSEAHTDRPWERIEQIQCVGSDIYVLGFSYFPMTIDGITINGNPGSYHEYLGPFIAKFNSSGVCTMGTALNPSYAPLNHYVFFSKFVVTNTAIYVAGSWRSPTEQLQFGDHYVSGYDDGDSTDYDILFAKIDLTGSIDWVKSIGGASDDELKSMCFDSSGNIYLGGEFSSTMIAGSVQLVSSGFKDVFIVRIDPSGNVLWGSKCGGTRDDTLSDMTERNGVVYLTGLYTLQTSFGSLILEPINTTTSTPGNIYIASITNSGAWNSVNRIGNPMYGVASASSIVVDDNNSAYILLPRASTNSYYPLQFGDDFSWYPSNIPITHQSHIIAGLNISANHWFGIAYAEVIYDTNYTNLRSHNQYLYMGTPVGDQVSFGSIDITATMSSCYAIGKISKSEVVENNDETNSVTNISRIRVFPNPAVANSSVKIDFDTGTHTPHSISIYNNKGQIVKSFIITSKSGDIEWNAMTDSGVECPSGVYFVRLRSKGGVTNGKFVYIK